MIADGPLKGKRVVLAHDAAALDGDAAARDVIDQMDAIGQALADAGAEAVRLPVGLDFGRLKRALLRMRPELVFNLVESLDGSDRLQTVFPLLLEDWGVPFTGSGSRAMLLSNHKDAAKRFLAAKGYPVPASAVLDESGGARFFPEFARAGAGEGMWIVKALESHASLYLDDASVVSVVGATELERRMRDATERHGEPFFAERYIAGREFNISLLETTDGCGEVLPAAEIRFVGFPPGKPEIVGHQAKWDEDSPEYRNTQRRFADGPEDAALAKTLADMSAGVWEDMELSGYARVDYRVDADGNPFILEVNVNPCLTPDAGFAAAAERAGMGFGEMCLRIAVAAL